MYTLSESENWLRCKHNQVDWLWMLTLLAAAVVLFGTNLGGLALRDWDEGTVAQVAREIWRSPDYTHWLFPTLGGEPYLNKPPLLHWLIAIAYSIGGVNEWTSRLPGATLTALSVPLLYGVGREIFHRRTPALFAALIYLTSLPVVRHGRLAMLDGAILCFALVMVWSVLRSRRDSRYAVGIGIGLGLLCLTKGIMVGMLLGAIAILFLYWDTPRLLTTPYLWLGILLGGAPVALWYWVQWLHYGQQFLGNNLVNQSFSRIWTSVENHGGYPWYYVLEVAKYGFPWLLFLPLGFKHTWENRNLSWAKLAIVWSVLYLVAISIMSTKLPWYVLPLYPALSLVAGQQLALLWDQGRHVGIKQPPLAPYSRVWVALFSLLVLVSGVGGFYYATLSTPIETDLAIVLIAVSITMAVAAVLIAQQDPQFISILIWGTYVALLLLMLSNHWVWELAEAYPVKPVAQLVQRHTFANQKIFTSFPYQRPSLDFYSDRRVIPMTVNQLERRWKRDPNPYLLLDSDTFNSIHLEPRQVLGTAEGWTLVTKIKNEG